jgi:hypothetical protein
MDGTPLRFDPESRRRRRKRRQLDRIFFNIMFDLDKYTELHLQLIHFVTIPPLYHTQSIDRALDCLLIALLILLESRFALISPTSSNVGTRMGSRTNHAYIAPGAHRISVYFMLRGQILKYSNFTHLKLFLCNIVVTRSSNI